MQKNLELMKRLKLIYQTPEAGKKKNKPKTKVKIFLELIVHLTLFMVHINNTSASAFLEIGRINNQFK